MFTLIKTKHKKTIAIIIVSIGIFIVFWFSWQRTPDFEQYAAGIERKTQFFNYFLPLIVQKNKEIAATRKTLQKWNESRNNIGWWDSRTLYDLAKQYRVSNFSIEDDAAWIKLLLNVDVLPPSLVLAQAANESAWGTSRFAKLGNNYFGQWCFEQGCGLVPKKRDSGKAHEVAAFNSPQESLESYMQNLNSHPAYQSLRNIRGQLRKDKQPVSGIALTAGLTSYSERGAQYIEELGEMIKFNQLEKYDQAVSGIE